MLLRNRITIEIAPSGLDYEYSQFDHLLLSYLSHELTHLVALDQSSPTTRSLQKLFKRPTFETSEPLTGLFSFLTTPNRYAPNWYHEGIALFMETWLNGGYGRVLGSFDEMFFRTLIKEGKSFPGTARIDFTDDGSHWKELIAYFYGARFLTWLSLEHDLEQLLDWLIIDAEQETQRIYFRTTFKQLFGLRLDEAWNAFWKMG